MNLAIIPARGGSKRIPRKNIKNFHGKPIIAYSIEAAIKSGCFDKIIVSTDDKEIAKVAKSYGAEIPFFRPIEIADDFATTMDVVQHALNYFIKKGTPPDHVCCIYATAPFLLPEYLQIGQSEIQNSQIQYAFGATSYSFPIQRAIKLTNDARVEMFFKEFSNTRSQDLIHAYHDAGQFYWGKASAFIEGKDIFDKHSKAIILPRKRVQDIDTQEDWDIAESLFNFF